MKDIGAPMPAWEAMDRVRLLAKEISDAEPDDDELIEANLSEIRTCLARFEKWRSL